MAGPRFPRIGSRPMSEDAPMPRRIGHPWPGAGDRPTRSEVVYPRADPVRVAALVRAFELAETKRRELEREVARVVELERRTLAELVDAGASLRDIAAAVGRSHTWVANEIARYARSQLQNADGNPDPAT